MIESIKTALCCALCCGLGLGLGLGLVIVILGAVGSSDYADARLQEKDICSRRPHPGWCDHAEK